MIGPDWSRAAVVVLALAAAGCGSATPAAPLPQPTPTPTVTPAPAPAPEPTPSPSPTPEACEDCEAPVSNTNPPVRLTLRLYTVEDGFGQYLQNPKPGDAIPVGWYARIDVTAKDVDNEETNGSKPISWNWTNGFLVKVTGNHTHQRRLKVLGAGTADFWVRQHGIESNRLTLKFGG